MYSQLWLYCAHCKHCQLHCAKMKGNLLRTSFDDLFKRNLTAAASWYPRVREAWYFLMQELLWQFTGIWGNMTHCLPHFHQKVTLENLIRQSLSRLGAVHATVQQGLFNSFVDVSFVSVWHARNSEWLCLHYSQLNTKSTGLSFTFMFLEENRHSHGSVPLDFIYWRNKICSWSGNRQSIPSGFPQKPHETTAGNLSDKFSINVRRGILCKKCCWTPHFRKSPHWQNVPQNGPHLLLEDATLLPWILMYRQHDESSPLWSQQMIYPR